MSLGLSIHGTHIDAIGEITRTLLDRITEHFFELGLATLVERTISLDPSILDSAVVALQHAIAQDSIANAGELLSAIAKHEPELAWGYIPAFVKRKRVDMRAGISACVALGHIKTPESRAILEKQLRNDRIADVAQDSLDQHNL